MTLLPDRDTPSVCSSRRTSTRPGVKSARTCCMMREPMPSGTRAIRQFGGASLDASDVDELRAMSRTHRIFTADEAVALCARRRNAHARAICAGASRPTSPGNTGRYVDDAVMPALADRARLSTVISTMAGNSR